MMHYTDVPTGVGVRYPQIDRIGFLTIPVLQFLNGKPWNDVALGYIHSLRPSMVRIARGGKFCDSHTWRVTVWLSDDNTIQKIEQEVEVALPDGCRNGAHLREMLEADG